MACNTCGSKTRIPPKTVAEARMMLPELTAEYDVYVEYLGEEGLGIVNRTVQGSVTRNNYRFSTGNQRQRVRKMVDTDEVRTIYEIHIADVPALLELKMKGKNLFAIHKVLKESVRLERERIAALEAVTVPTPVVIPTPVAIPTPVLVEEVVIEDTVEPIVEVETFENTVVESVVVEDTQELPVVKEVIKPKRTTRGRKK